MLKLKDVPNAVDKTDFGGAPNIADGENTKFIGAACYAVWPALTDDDKHVQVCINITGFSDATGQSLGQDSFKVGFALKKYRDLIQQRANEKWDGKSVQVLIF
jgi:hypothetical protein